jgi:hypothetical protein
MRQLLARSFSLIIQISSYLISIARSQSPTTILFENSEVYIGLRTNTFPARRVCAAVQFMAQRELLPARSAHSERKDEQETS